jgi:NADPH:quinone reductase-like Zn-dependent oxidoreductase
VRQANDGALFGVTLDCVGGAMTNLCVDAVDYEGQVVSIVNGPRDNAQDVSIADEETLFEKSAAFHFELVFALAEQPDTSRHAIYAAQLGELATMIDAGTIKLPKITDIGALTATTVRKAHAQLEGGHTTGKLVARVD